MTPEQGRATAALMMISRLIRHQGLTGEEAATAVAQRIRGEEGPHTHLVTVEAAAMLAEMTAPIRAFMEALRPAVMAATETMAAILGRLAANTATAAGRCLDRPAWASPYGPPTRRR
ncbi:hypothetical protein [Streptomyces sp. NBC_01207]|uniref:hypothetical protein n=1 Tax=Streptomyces sp. NBC_01207 TaxID=2903772 RepID=UPI002E124ACC|nr:hypothetical protein OG457_27375 [Streptomyces sp. NBC_01207]